MPGKKSGEGFFGRLRTRVSRLFRKVRIADRRTRDARGEYSHKRIGERFYPKQDSFNDPQPESAGTLLVPKQDVKQPQDYPEFREVRTGGSRKGYIDRRKHDRRVPKRGDRRPG